MELDPPPLQHHPQSANSRISALNSTPLHLPIKKARPGVPHSNSPTAGSPRPKGETHPDAPTAAGKPRRTSSSANSSAGASPASSPVSATREPATEHGSSVDAVVPRHSDRSSTTHPAPAHVSDLAPQPSSSTVATASGRVVPADDVTSEEQIGQCVGYTASSQDTTIIACTMNGCQKYFANIDKFGAHRRSEHSTNDIESEVWIFGNPAGANRTNNIATSPTTTRDTKGRTRSKTQTEIVPIDDLISAVTNSNSSTKRHLDANQDESHSNSAAAKRPRDQPLPVDETQRRGATSSDRRASNEVRESQIGGTGIGNGNSRPQQQQQQQQQRAMMMMDSPDRRDRYMMMQQPVYSSGGGVRRPGGGMDANFPMPPNLSVERGFNEIDTYYNAIQQRMTTQRGFSPPPGPPSSRNFMSPSSLVGAGPPAPGGGGYPAFEPMDVVQHAFSRFGDIGAGVPGGGYATYEGQYYEEPFSATMGPTQASAVGVGRRFGPAGGGGGGGGAGGGGGVGGADGGKGTGPGEMVVTGFTAMQQFLPPRPR